MAKTTAGRIVRVKNTKEGLERSAKVFKKHQTDGADSELHNLEEDYDWNVVGPTIATAQAHHDKAEELKGLMEEEYRLRDLAYVPIKDITDASAKYLKGKYSKNPKKLAEWGFPIDDTPPVKKKASKPAQAATE